MCTHARAKRERAMGEEKETKIRSNEIIKRTLIKNKRKIKLQGRVAAIGHRSATKVKGPAGEGEQRRRQGGKNRQQAEAAKWLEPHI